MPSRNMGPTTPAFGLIGWLEETRVVLPLKGVEAKFLVQGDLLSVEVDQIFHHQGTQPVDCLYSFPLPANAAVYRCEMHVNGRVIVARIEERARAAAIAREKKAAGHRTSLVEMERDNLFTLSLGNVQPQEVVVIRLAYFQTLSYLGDWASFNLPVCPGIRYIPGQPLLRSPQGQGTVDDTDQVPDASRLSPPRIDRFHPDAAYFWVEGALEASEGSVRDVSSPSHPVLVRENPGELTIAMAEANAVPDQDFVLRWTIVPPQEVQWKAWRMRGEKGTYVLLQGAAPAPVPEDKVEAQDFYFLLDRSGSMQGMKWVKTAQAFHDFLRLLPAGDRVWATVFESGFRDFAEKPLPAAELFRDPAVLRLKELGVAGGTELLPALAHVLKNVEEHSKEAPASIIIITDGQVGNESSIVQEARRHPRLRFHTFGIDTAVNDGLLRKLAEQSGGTCVLLHTADDISGAVTRSVGRLRRPLLTAVEVGPNWESPNSQPPALHPGEVRALTFRALAKEAELAVGATLADGTQRRFAVTVRETSAAAIPLLWAKRRIEHHLAAQDSAAAIALAKESNLLCEGVSFLAWDETEKVPVAAHEIYQPSHLMKSVVGPMRAAAAPGEREGTTLFRRFCVEEAEIGEPGTRLGHLRSVVGRVSEPSSEAEHAKSRQKRLLRLIAELELGEAKEKPALEQAILKWLNSAATQIEDQQRDQAVARLLQLLELLQAKIAAAIEAYGPIIAQLNLVVPPARPTVLRVSKLLAALPVSAMQRCVVSASLPATTAPTGATAATATDLERLAASLAAIQSDKQSCEAALRVALGVFDPGGMVWAR